MVFHKVDVFETYLRDIYIVHQDYRCDREAGRKEQRKIYLHECKHVTRISSTAALRGGNSQRKNQGWKRALISCDKTKLRGGGVKRPTGMGSGGRGKGGERESEGGGGGTIRSGRPLTLSICPLLSDMARYALYHTMHPHGAFYIVLARSCAPCALVRSRTYRTSTYASTSPRPCTSSLY